MDLLMDRQELINKLANISNALSIALVDEFGGEPECVVLFNLGEGVLIGSNIAEEDKVSELVKHAYEQLPDSENVTINTRLQ